MNACFIFTYQPVDRKNVEWLHPDIRKRKEKKELGKEGKKKGRKLSKASHHLISPDLEANYCRIYHPEEFKVTETDKMVPKTHDVQ